MSTSERIIYDYVTAWEFEDLVLPRIAVGPAEECWPWVGPVMSCGDGRAFCAGKSRPAHRVVAQWVGIIPDFDSPLWVIRECGERLCCNPAHLRAIPETEGRARLLQLRRAARVER